MDVPDATQDSPGLAHEARAAFRASIVRNAAYMLNSLKEADESLPAAQVLGALRGLHFALQLPEAWMTARDLLLTLAPHMEKNGERMLWVPYLERAVQLAEAGGDCQAAAYAQYRLGIMYQLGGNFDDASRTLEQSALNFAQAGNAAGQAEALAHRAYVLQVQDHDAEAAALLAAAESLLPPEHSVLAYCALVRGLVAYGRRAWDEAIGWFERSRRLHEQLGAHRMVASNLVNLGMACRAAARYAEAKAYYQEAIALFSRLDDLVNLANGQMNMGNLYVYTGQPRDALACYQLVEPVYRRLGNPGRLAMLHTNFGKALRQLKQWDQAEAHYRAAIELHRDLEMPKRFADTLDGLGMLFKEKGQEQLARPLFQEALDLLDSLEPDAGTVALRAEFRAHLDALNDPS